MTRKAYMVYPGDSPHDHGCVLVFADSRNHARLIASDSGPWWCEYIDMRARRQPHMDEYAEQCDSYLVETNDHLPDGVKFFIDDTELVA